MFANVNRAGRYEYVRVLETYYENGEQKKRVVANLGRLDRIRDNLPRLAKRLAELGGQPLLAPDDVQAVDALPWGPALLARHLYEELRLDQIISDHCSSQRRKFDLAETAFVLLANRLIAPRSEHGLARWLETTYVCDRHGRRCSVAKAPKIPSGRLSESFRFVARSSEAGTRPRAGRQR